jgi:hypothetical protein
LFAFICTGLSPEIRIFETQTVTGENRSTGLILRNVISEPDWVGNMNRFNLGLIAHAGIAYKVSPSVELTAGAGYYHGMTSLDHRERANYETDKYTGQFNPLWGNSSKTLNREFSVRVGIVLVVNKMNK